MVYLELTLVALVVIYIVDLSGFTQSWRAALTSALHIKALKPLPPFDCGTCMVWWTCLIYAICIREVSIFTIAYCALLSWATVPVGSLLSTLKYWIVGLIGRIKI